MIILDTHILVWWLNDPSQLPDTCKLYIDQLDVSDISISVITCWEIAMLVEHKRISLVQPIDLWMCLAVSVVKCLPITPSIAVASTQLPGTFHKDPADRLIVATAKEFDCPIMTLDKKIIDYPHVITVP